MSVRTRNPIRKVGIGRFRIALPQAFGYRTFKRLHLDFALVHGFIDFGYFRVELINGKIELVAAPVFLTINGGFVRQSAFLAVFSAHKIRKEIETLHLSYRIRKKLSDIHKTLPKN